MQEIQKNNNIRDVMYMHICTQAGRTCDACGHTARRYDYVLLRM